MQTLYPDIHPYQEHQLSVSDIHTLYIEESGNPDGIPVLFIHGGPGGGSNHQSRCFFDPDLYRIIVFDQRGAGKSTPHAALNENTTQDLINDIESIRKYLSIKAWVLFGGSWGATLSLLYAQSFPEKVLALILRGIFLCRQKDLQWFYQEGASRLFPDEWQHYKDQIPAEEQTNFIHAYYNLLTSKNELKQITPSNYTGI
mgnify:FL=1